MGLAASEQGGRKKPGGHHPTLSNKAMGGLHLRVRCRTITIFGSPMPDPSSFPRHG